MKISNAHRGFALVMVALATMPASAAGRTSTLSVKAQVTPTCDIGGSGSIRHLARGLLDFGTHPLGNDAVLQSQLSELVPGTLPIWCNTTQATPTVAFDRGLHARGEQRQMHGPGDALVPYRLLRGDSTSAGDWDDMPHPVQITTDKDTNIPVYGYILALPASAAGGLYTDTVTVQLDF